MWGRALVTQGNSHREGDMGLEIWGGNIGLETERRGYWARKWGWSHGRGDMELGI